MSQLSIGQRIKFLLDANGGSIRKFARMLDVSDTNIRNYIERGTKPSSDALEGLLRNIPHLNPAWLLTGDGEPFLPDTAPTTTNTTHIKNNSGIGINNGNATITLEACQRELATSHKDSEHLRAQLASAEALLAAKDATIAAQAETILLLRATYTRPN